MIAPAATAAETNGGDHQTPCETAADGGNDRSDEDERAARPARACRLQYIPPHAAMIEEVGE